MTLRNTIALSIGLFGGQVMAAECLDVFPDPAASYAAASKIVFEEDAKLIGTDGVIT